MEDYLNQLTAIIAPAIITIVGGFVSLGLAMFTKWIHTKTKNENINEALGQISEVAMSVVSDLEKSVKRASLDGKLTPQEAIEIKKNAIDKVKVMAPKALRAAQKGGINFLDDFVAGKVEEMVAITKQMKKN